MKKRMRGYMGVSVIAAMIVTVAAPNHNAFAGTVKVKGSYAETFVSVNFSYDGVSPATLGTHTGQDNIGGRFSGQMLAEYLLTGNSCTAPDGSAGVTFVLVQATAADNYNQGQLYYAAVGASAGSGCASSKTASVSETLTLPIVGGTGKFASASGSIMLKFTGYTLAAGQAWPSGSFGIFGDSQVTKTGSVTCQDCNSND